MSEVGKSEVAKREEKVLAFWKEQQIFERSVGKRAPRGEFTFYDGPPFATGLPHHGSLLSSIIKDVVPRYKTMRGYRVPRRWGWDCHGLPIENLVEKKLGLKTKKDILSIGIDTFNEEARSTVLQYVHDWEQYVDRVGRWVDFRNSYKTMDNSYIETVWWALKEMQDKKLLYEGRKVLMYCPHCETPLAKAEIAADNTYKDITEEAVTIKFKLKYPQKFGLPENTYLLAWTTTPWTLPGNVGLAVGPDIPYVLVEQNGEYLVLARDLKGQASGTVAGELLGRQMVGADYEPLYRINAVEAHKGRKHQVLAADFVTTTEGTGIVHTAVMYGEDDFALGQKEGLPMVQLLSQNGTYNDNAPEFVRGEYIKKAEKLIKEDLEEKGLLFSRANHTHSYPHCWRCGTALIYNAVASWFINIQKVKAKMLSENQKINWVPAYLRDGRFRNILENAPDWTISRNRFWASPLPIWKEKGGKNLMVVGSVEELLKKTKRSGNKYFVMRHGEARHNVEDAMDGAGRPDNHLTDAGREYVRAAAQEFKKRQEIDLIVMSPFVRTRETAAIVQEVFGLPDSAVAVDNRLHEIGFGEFEGRPLREWAEFFGSLENRFLKTPEGGEPFSDVRRRVGDFLFEIERRYVGKNILIVTHKGPGWLLNAVAKRYSAAQIANEEEYSPFMRNDKAQRIYELPFTPFPHNKDYEMDLHRPYIDAITLVDAQGRGYERIPEVIDCWVESGAMPYASNHYPFKNKNRFNPARFFGLWPKGFPAQFIAEYIGQTRTWFYYMLAVSTVLSGRASFQNVVSTGNLLAADGAKLSKSKGNYTDPLNIMNQFGADAYRFYLMGSVVMNSEDLQFRDEDVREANNRVLGILWNCYKFFELYKDERDPAIRAQDSSHPLDRWVLSLLNKTTAAVTAAMEAYDTPGACKALRAFVDDYSTWYVRRSRDRVKGEDEADKQFALATQYEVLLTLSQLFAPITPYISESIYRSAGGEEDSVHLSEWPEAGAVDEKLLADMEVVRKTASMALEARERAGIKIRQPLGKLSAKSLPADLGLRQLIAEEVNVKEIIEDVVMEDDISLDTTMTPELRDEGIMRTLMRRVQEWRKDEQLTIADRPDYTLVVTAEENPVAQKYREEIRKATGLNSLEITVE
ncbi:MAG TPA: class I tRNA ligase family protein [Candidatus Paceibacterota bacterium]|nr:class I tRNA ligase family protein [Candidatus Paceibacterota bacterium]